MEHLDTHMYLSSVKILEVTPVHVNVVAINLC